MSDNVELLSKTNVGPYYISNAPAIVYAYHLCQWFSTGSRGGESNFALLPRVSFGNIARYFIVMSLGEKGGVEDCATGI